MERLTMLSGKCVRGSWPWLALMLLTSGVLHATERKEQALAYLERVRAEAGVPGLSAAVAVRGEIVFSGGVGLANLEQGTPQQATTVHNIGSVSKVLAAVAVMQLVEQGKIKLDAEIQAYVPWFPRKEAPITVLHIMTHTSGIRHYKEGEFGEGEILRFRQFDTFEESTRRWRDDPLLFKPGQYISYSSYSVNLLQGVVESASGMPFETYLRERLWQPAGMLATQFDVPARVIARRGTGYERKNGRLLNAVEENVSYKYAGGGMLSTDEDLVRFGHALNAGVLLKPTLTREMYRPQLPAEIKSYEETQGWTRPDAADRLGLMWRLHTDASGRRIARHSGGVRGTATEFANYVDEDVIVAVHCNAAEAPDLKEISRNLAALFFTGQKVRRRHGS